MTFRLQAGALARAVAQVAPLTKRDAKIPILAHLHLSAAGGVLSVRGTDLDTELTVEARGDDGGLPSCTASARRLAALTARLPPEATVALSVAPEGQLILDAERLRARLFTLPAEDFAEIAASPPPNAPLLTIQAASLLRLLDRPAHAISTEETRYYLNGLHIHRAGDTLRSVATDGHRLFIAEEPFPAESGVGNGIILPRLAAATLRALVRALPPEAPITWRWGDTKADITGRGWRVRAKLIDGTFPKYEQVIPAEAGTPIRVADSKGFANAIRAVSSISEERSRPVKLSNGTGTTLRLSCQSVPYGDASEELPAEIAAWGSDEPHPEFGVQARYLLDLCRALPGGFTLRVASGSAPIHVSGAEGFGALMPMRI